MLEMYILGHCRSSDYAIVYMPESVCLSVRPSVGLSGCLSVCMDASMYVGMSVSI